MRKHFSSAADGLKGLKGDAHTDGSIYRPRRAASLDQNALTEYRNDPRRAITESGVVCLVCGRSFRHLTNTHLRAHGLTSSEYKQHFGYNIRRALMVATVRRTHSENASKAGLAARIRRRPILEDIEVRRMGGRHAHSLEEALTRRDRHTLPPPFTGPRDRRGRFTTPQAPDSEGSPEVGGEASLELALDLALDLANDRTPKEQGAGSE